MYKILHPKHPGSMLRRQMSVWVTLKKMEVDSAEFSTQNSSLMSKDNNNNNNNNTQMAAIAPGP